VGSGQLLPHQPEHLARLRFVVLALVVAALAACGGGGSPAALPGTVTFVVDGDTLHVQLPNDREERVRVLGIDTPERGECGYARARAFATRLANGMGVSLTTDPTQARRDRFGRLLAYVGLPDGRDLGEQQLKRGYARVFVFDRLFARVDAYRAAERQGRRVLDGVWRRCPG
jgi:endonuclease YncB( thermonuclease family)